LQHPIASPLQNETAIGHPDTAEAGRVIIPWQQLGERIEIQGRQAVIAGLGVGFGTHRREWQRRQQRDKTSDLEESDDGVTSIHKTPNLSVCGELTGGLYRKTKGRSQDWRPLAALATKQDRARTDSL
jgi:hypothetical protein